HHHAVRHGQLQGVAIANPFLSSPADDVACATPSACTDYRLHLTLPRAQRRSLLAVDVRSDLSSGPFSLRLLDNHGNVVATTSDGYGDIDDQHATQGSHLLARIAPGRYVLQIDLTAGQAAYTAAFDWR